MGFILDPLYRSVQANQRNVMVAAKTTAIVFTVWYYLLNAVLLIMRAVYSAVIAYVAILIVGSQSYASSVDATIRKYILNVNDLFKCFVLNLQSANPFNFRSSHTVSSC